jgi:hypothetical protein
LDSAIHDGLAALITALLCGYALLLLVRGMSRSRPGLQIGAPIAAALALRVIAAAAVSLTGFADFLRGGDEKFFLANARDVTATAFGSSDWISSLTGSLHEFVFAVQIDLFDSPDLVLRITQSAIAVAGLALFAVAAYELAGARAAWITAWLLALEPSGVFFSSLLHKEPNMFLAAGLVAYGGAMIWKQGSPRWLLPMAAGCLVAVATRPYAGWFLIAASAAIVLHAGLRAGRAAPARRFSLVAVVLLLAAIAAPTVLQASTDESLEKNLQSSQDANANDSSNLGLEQVDFSSRTAIVTNLPRRVVDVLTRPYLWQVDNISQQLAVLGSLITLTVIALLIASIWRDPKGSVARAGPFLYVAVALLLAYSLSAGNAGTAFRYRTHVIVPAIAALVCLRTRREEEPAAEAARPEEGPGRTRALSATA